MSALKLELCCEFQAFADSHSLEQDIILLHISRKCREVATHLIALDAINEDLALFV